MPWDDKTDMLTETFASSTDPATDAAVSTAIVDANSGVLITLTAAGNAQTLQPPSAFTVKKFTVVNNDTSTHSIVVNGITLPPDKGQTFIWDGTAWGPASLGITAVPVPVTEGGTGRSTGTTAYGLLAAGTTATGAQQTLPAGATTEIPVGGGAGSLPVWTTATGSGAPVRAESPTLVTPTIGVASATSLNKVTVTAPATGSTLTIADGKTAAINDNLTVTAGQAVTLAAEDAAGSITLDNTLFEVENTDATQRTVKITSAKAGDTTLTLQENLTVGDGFDVSITAEDAAGTVTLDNATLEVENTNATQREMKLSVGTDANAALSVEGTAAAVNQDVTSDASPTFTAVNAITFDTNVAAAGVTLAGTTLAADGTDADINIAITPKGTGEVDISNKIHVEGGVLRGAGGNYDQVSVNADFKGTDIDKETDIFFDSGAVGKDSAFRYVGGDGTGNWGRGYYHKYDKTNNQLAFGYNSAGNYKDASAVPQDNDHLVIKSDGSVSISNVDIDGGAIDGTTVGSATPAAGTFTSVETDNLSFAVDINRYGFTDRAETTLAFDDTTYTLTLTDAGAGWSYYRAGIKHTITGNKTVTLTGTPPSAGTYFVYIDGTTGALVEGAVWTLNDTKVLVAAIIWDNTKTPKYHLVDERHTSLIDRKVHEKWHNTVGTLLKALGTISGQTISGSTDAENTFGVGTSYIYDEDILHTLTAIADPDGATPTYNVFYRTAASTYAWEVSNVPFKYTGAGYVEYDNAGTMTAGTHSDFYNSYLVCTPFGFVMLPGRGEFTTLAAAQAENPQTFDFTGFAIAESVIVRQFTWEARSVLGTLGKCRLAAAPRVISISVTSAVVPAENVGTIASQDSDNVNITGGNITDTKNAGTTGGMQVKFVEAVSAALSGATGTITLNIPANSWIRGVQLRVDTLIETATGWDAAFSGGNTAAIGTGLAVAADTKVSSFSGGLATNTTDITLTASGGNFSAGVVRAIAYYDTLVAMGDA